MDRNELNGRSSCLVPMNTPKRSISVKSDTLEQIGGDMFQRSVDFLELFRISVLSSAS